MEQVGIKYQVPRLLTYNTGALTQTMQYRVYVYAIENGCEDVFSQIVTVTVVEDLTITSQPQDIEECIGGADELSVSTNGGTGTITYQWQSSASNFPAGFGNIGGATSPTYMPQSTNVGTTYYRVMIDIPGIGCDDIISGVATVIIRPDATITVSPDSTEICTGGSADLTASFAGGSSSASYQWQYSLDSLGGWVNVGLPNTSILTVSPTDLGLHYYRVVVSDPLSDCGQPVSKVLFVRVRPDATVSVSPLLTEVCIDGAALLTATVMGGSSQLLLQWENSSDPGGPWSDIVGETASTYSAPTVVPGTLYYRIRISDNTIGCAEPYSAIMTVTVTEDLIVSVEPVSIAECVGGTEEMNVQVNGGLGNLGYQWQSSNTGLSASFADISGANSASFIPPSLVPGTTWYRVIISADGVGCDNIISDTARAVISPDIQITAQPIGFEGCVGAIETLTVSALYGTGTLSYQWQSSTATGPFAWSDIVGAQQSTYSPSTLVPGTTWYRVVISAPADGCDDISTNPVEVIIAPDPIVTIEADEYFICDGGVGVFSSVVTGGSGGSNYQWQQEIGGVWSHIDAANNSDYSTPVLTEGTYTYRLLVTQSTGCYAVSNVVVIDVVPDPMVTVTASLDQFCEGGQADLHVEVSGGAGTVLYQWEQFISGLWTIIPAATSEDYTTLPLSVGVHFFRVVVSQNSGCETISDQFPITVVPDPVVSVQPSATFICVGGNVDFTSTISGGVGANAYQWEQLNSLTSSWEVIIGATSSTYSTGTLSVSGTYSYRLFVAQTIGCASYSPEVVITVTEDPIVTVQAQDLSICVGGATTLVSQVTGGAGDESYQWQQYVLNVGFENIVGATSAFFVTEEFLSPGTYTYRIIVTQNSGCESISSELDILVVDDPVVTVVADEFTICEGGIATLHSTVIGGSGDNIYQWQIFDNNLSEWVDIDGANNGDYTSGLLSLGTYEYRIFVTQNTGCESAADGIIIVVTPDISITAQPQGGSICSGGDITMSVTATGATNIQYRWEILLGSLWTPLSGATMSTYNTGPLSTTTQYRVFVFATESGCEDVFSSIISVIVTPDIAISAQPIGGSICTGGNFDLSVTASGSPNILFQWEQLIGSTWTTIAGATLPTYNTGVLTTTTQYRVFVSATESGCEDVFSSIVSVIVTPDIAISAQPVGGSICTGGNFDLSVTASGSPNILYQWEQLIGSTWTTIAGATLPTYNTGVLTATTQYRVFVSATESGCEDVFSSIVSVIVTPDIAISAQPIGGSICTGGNFDLSVTASGSPNILYQWEQLIGSTWTTIAGATLPTYNTGVLTATTQYRVFVSATESGCEDVFSSIVSVIVTPDIAISAQPVGGSICTGGNFDLSVTASGSPNILYQWEQLIGSTWTTIAGATLPTYNTGVLTTTTQYRVFVSATESGCEDVFSSIVSVIVTPDIAISAQPVGGSICTGGNFDLSVTASGSPNILYQWEQLIGSTWTTIAGATLPTYNTGVLTTTTQYRVFVSATESGCEDVFSSIVSVIVTPDIAISAQPVGGSICTGGNFDLSVTASGSPNILYQWEQLIGSTWTTIAGATLPTYNTGVLTTTTQYRVFVSATESGCEDVFSSIVSVIVTPDIAISAQPVGGSICTGGNFDLSVTASGSPNILYQWEQLIGSTWTTIAGATLPTYNTGVLTATTQYRVFVSATESGCEDVFSSIVSVIVTPDIAISAQPIGGSICTGGNFDLSVTASGSPNILYQWEQLIGSTWTTIAGATLPTYNTGVLTTTTQYRVFVSATESGCEDVFSSIVSVIVTPDIAISAQPVGGSICTGGNFDLSVTASGSPNILYQWEQLIGSTWTTISGATLPTYNTGILTTTTQYRVFVSATESGCEDVFSSIVSVIVTPDIAISAQPIGGSICTGGNFDLSVTASGSPNILYQWEQLIGSTWTTISGATLPTYNTGVLTATTQYRVFVSATESGCEDVFSSIVSVIVTPDIAISAQPLGGSICTGGNFDLSVTASGSPNILYQWEQLIGSTWTTIAGATLPTYNTGVLTATTQYRVFVSATESGCEDVFSSIVSVIVTPDIAISAQPVGGSICTGGNFDLSVTASGSPNILYQWEQLIGSTWTTIAGATLPTYNTGVLTTTTQYRVFVSATESGCEDVFSSIVSVIVTPDIAISAQPIGGSICTGGNFDLSVTASGSPSILYQWEQLIGSTWTTIAGATLPTYNTGVLTATTQYRVYVSATESGCEDVFSSIVSVIVTPDIAISAQPVGGSICTGGNFDLSVTASGSPNILYQWEQLIGSTWTTIAGATLPTYNTGVLTATTQYRVFVSATESGCEDVFSSIVSVIVTPDIAISAQPIGGSICTGGNFDLSVTASGSPNILYQWEQLIGSTWTTIAGATLPTYNTGVLTTTTQYRVFVSATESGCEDVFSSIMSVIVTPDIAISAQPVGGSICTGGNFDLSVTASGSPNILYQWEQLIGSTWTTIAGATLPTYNTGVLTTTTQYRVFVSATESGCEDVFSSIVSVIVTPDIAISAQPIGGSICTGGNFDLSVTASGSPNILYQWEQLIGSTWTTIAGATLPTYNTGALTTTTQYRVYVSATESGCEDVFSSIVSVIVTPDIAISAQPVGGSICTGGNFDLSVTASGSPNILYQWEQLIGSTWTTITGATLPTYNTGVLTATTQYRVFVSATESGCEDVFSSIVSVIVTPDIAISVQPIGGSICTGGNFDLSVTASGSPNILYQWEQLIGSTWTTIAGATLPTYNTGVLTTTTQYRVFVSATESGCEDVFSSIVSVIVTPDIAISAQPVGGSICTGGNFDLSVTASGSPNILYQWEQLIGSTWTTIAGATLPTYNTGVLTTTTQYRVFVSATESGCEDVFSSIVSVIVTPDIAISAQPVGGSICTGGNFDLSVTASGSPNILYQWEQLIGSTWTTIAGATLPTYNTGVLTTTTQYRVFVSATESGCEDVFSSIVSVIVTPDIAISAQPVGGSICTGGNFDLSVTASGSPNILYQWEQLIGSTWTTIAGATLPTYNTGVLTTTTQYRVFVSATESGCEDVFSSIMSVIVTPDIAISAEPVGGSICTGGNFDLSVTASGSPNILYQWEQLIGSTWTTIAGATLPTYNTGVLTTTTQYRVYVSATESGCEDVFSSIVSVIVTPDIAISAQPVGGSICTGGNFDLSVTASGSPNILYQWEQLIGSTWTTIAGATLPTYNTGVLTATTQYRVFVSATESGCEDVFSSIVSVIVTPDIAISAQPVGGSICTGGNFDLSVTASGSPNILFQWEQLIGSTWTTIAGATLPTYNTGVLTTTTQYRVFVSATESGCEDVFSSIVSVIVTPDIAISAQPVGGSICTGGNFDLSVTASGSPNILYQWEQLIGSTWTTIAGATLPTYNTGVLTATTQYRVFVSATESGCEDVFSSIVSVIVTPDIAISAQPIGGSICTGGNFDLSVTASGSPNILYQWEQLIGSTWTTIAGATLPTYNTGALTTTTQYRVFVSATESGCEDVFSSIVSVIVTPDIAISAQPVGGSICTGGNFDLSVTASGSPNILYQWEQLIGSTWTTIAGATLPTYNTGVLTTTTQYRVYVSATESGCEDVFSSIVSVIVTPDIAISAQPVGGSICTGGNFDLSVTASGSPNILYQWEQLIGSTWTTIAGATLPTYNTGVLTTTTQYRVFVSATESGCEDVFSSIVSVIVTPDIAISAQPVGGSICTGGNFDLSVTASGSPNILYQWEQLIGSTWTTIAGATLPTFNTGVLTATTQYRVFVSATESGCEDVFSSIVSVIVTPDIAISAQPVGGSICTGGNFDLSVTASGSPNILYQWEQLIGSTWTTIAGATLPTYNTGVLTATTQYRVFVSATESGCEDVFSSIVSVIVTPDIAISAQPVGGSICTGGNFDLSVTASGSPNILYQWEQLIGSTWTTIAGATLPTYNTGVLTTTTQYRVFVSATESGCEDVFSSIVSVIVTPDIAISAQPIGGSICTGGNFDLSVTASGSPNILYQWEQLIGSTWTTIAGATLPTYNTGVLTTTTQYRVFVSATESGCEDVFSSIVSVIVTPDIAISAQPVGGSICTGGNFDLSVTASGSPNILYQWEQLIGSTWTTIAGATLPTYNTGVLTTTTQYRVFVSATESGCEDVFSSIVSVIVTPDIAISAQPVGGSICTGGNFDLSVTASGSPSILYQWEQLIGSTWTTIAGATLPTYNTGVLTTTTQYRVFVSATESGCEDVFSSIVSVIVTPDIAISAQPIGGSICTGGNFDLSVTASGSPNILYQWEQLIGSTWTTIAGATLPTYNTGVLTTTTQYRVFVSATESGCEDVFSSIVSVIVTPDIAISAQPVGGSICTGGNFDLSVTASGSPNILYQWEQLIGSTWTTIAGATLPTFNTGVLTATTQYRVFVSATESGCEDVFSSIVSVIVTPDIAISAQPVGGSICTGGNFDLSVTASGSPNILYQWEQLIGSTWTTIAGATLPTYNTGVLTATTQYRVFVSATESGCEDVFSSIVSVIVTPDIAISAQPVGGSICTGGNFDLSVTASGSPNILYQWEQLIGSTWTTIAGATLPTYNTGVLTTTTQYRVFVSATESGCEDVFSSIVSVIVTPDIAISAQPIGGSICTGGNFDLSVTASGSPNILYQWEQLIGSTWTTIAGATLPTYNTGVLTTTTQYRVFVSATESGCEDVFSSIVSVIVTPDIAISAQPVGGSICTGGNFDLSVTASGSPNILYQWEQLIGSTWTTIAGATLPTYNTGVLTTTTQYRVFVSATESGCEDVFSSIVSVIVTPDIAISAQPVGGSICTGGNFDLSVTASGSPSILYQWEQLIGSTWTTIAGATLPTYNTGVLTTTTQYRVFVSATESGCEDVFSSIVSVIVTPDIAISAQPIGGSICTGGNFDLSVTASGSPNILYQWEQLIGSTWTTIAGATLPTYNTGVLTTTTQYRVFVSATESGCEDVFSSIVSVIVTPDIAISAQPVGGSICTGGNFDLSVTASGSPDIHYQWQSFDGTNWGNVGTDQNTYNTGILTTTTTYRVFVNADESGCEDVMSVEVIVVVSLDVFITSQPQNIIECVGGDEMLSVQVSGGSGNISYQWQSSLDGSTGWADIAGAQGITYQPLSLIPGTIYYRVLVSASNIGCDQATSIAASVLVAQDPLVIDLADDNEICEGGFTILHSEVVGGTGTNAYQWQEQIAGVWYNIAGENGPDYTTDILDVGSYAYRVVVIQDTGCEGVGNGEVVVVNSDPLAFDSAIDNEICGGGSTILESEVVGGAGTNSYQWQQFLAGQWVDIFGANQANYTTELLGVGSYTYRVIVFQDFGCEAVADGETIIVTSDPLVYDSADDNEICAGGTTTLHTEVVGGAGTNAYQWQQYFEGVWVDIFGANNTDYTTELLDEGSYTYRVIVTQDSGCEGVSDEEIIVVNDDPDVYDSAEDNEFCDGGYTILHSEVVGGAGGNAYQWQQFTAGSWVDIFGENGADFQTSALSEGTYEYRLVVTQDAGCEAVSDGEIILVSGDPSVIDFADDNEICEGGMTFLFSEVTGGSGNNTYQWQQFLEGNWIDIFGANGADYTTEELSVGSYTYRVMIIQDSGCEAVSIGPGNQCECRSKCLRYRGG